MTRTAIMLDTPLDKLPDVPKPIRKAAEQLGWKTLAEIDREVLGKQRGVGRQMLFIYDGLIENGKLRANLPKRGRPPLHRAQARAPERQEGYTTGGDVLANRIEALEDRAAILADHALACVGRDRSGAITNAKLAHHFAVLATDLHEIRFRRQVKKGLNGHA